MIILTRLNGECFALNSDLVERVDATPDTVITLVDATKYVVSDSLLGVVDAIRDFRASVIARAGELQAISTPDVRSSLASLALRLVQPEEG